MTTFVTAFIDLKEPRQGVRAPDTYIAKFQQLADTGINLHLFVSQSFCDRIPERDNIHTTVIELEDLDTFKELAGLNPALPSVRSHNKDTRAYLTLMNSKTEFIRRAIDQNPFNTDGFAWIDFGIFHMLHDSVEKLKSIGKSIPGNHVYIPGCWDRCYPLFSHVFWRFCGSFFIGNRQAMLTFDSFHQTMFRKTVIEKNVLSWEVNMWALYEMQGWTPIWYLANHNDTLLLLPETFKDV